MPTRNDTRVATAVKINGVAWYKEFAIFLVPLKPPSYKYFATSEGLLPVAEIKIHAINEVINKPAKVTKTSLKENFSISL